MSKTLKVIAATAIGFAAGILLAPKSGKETRKDIKDKAVDAKVYADEKAQQVKAAAKDGVETLKHGADKLGHEAGMFADSARTSAGKVGKEASKLADEAKTRAGHVADETKRTANRVAGDIKNNVK